MTATPDGLPFEAGPRTITLRVRITPKGGRDAIDGLTDTAAGKALKVRVRAAPEDGAANAALVDLVAGALQIPGRNIALVSGHKSRVKLLALSGDGAVIAARLSELIATGFET